MTDRLSRPERRALQKADALILPRPLALSTDPRPVAAHIRHVVRLLRDPAAASPSADAVAHITALYDRTVEVATPPTLPAIACRKGCAHCCTQMVLVTAPEAFFVGRAITQTSGYGRRHQGGLCPFARPDAGGAAERAHFLSAAGGRRLFGLRRAAFGLSRFCVGGSQRLSRRLHARCGTPHPHAAKLHLGALYLQASAQGRLAAGRPFRRLLRDARGPGHDSGPPKMPRRAGGAGRTSLPVFPATAPRRRRFKRTSIRWSPSWPPRFRAGAAADYVSNGRSLSISS